ncbi:Hsp20/alpha crystallin family protein [Noviherbaspirillum pedocola]|uniref:Hsp20/alpha crystallin family protein n=1 Tax=Noviherbaspirillum pedocola TaxID=2801341 RepID=A0A934T496_9BURK|nr:Hsp20/alpha crystallin family protein [Noviherbaspirillum pedocola]MBK4739148.1 Hsp20/alpha crystallin family protein [Noviherbaspirillum pedocola]
MLYQSTFARDIRNAFTELAELQRQAEQLFDFGPDIRGSVGSSFPHMNIGETPESVELYVFVPGIDADSIDLTIENGVLTISGERADNLSTGQQEATAHLNERFAGRFKRVLSLPDDMDADRISAQYRDGILHVSIKRKEAAQPRRISVQ